MQKNNELQKCKATSPLEETFPETSPCAKEEAKLMTTIINSEQTVPERIDPKDKTQKHSNYLKWVTHVYWHERPDWHGLCRTNAKTEMVITTCAAWQANLASLEDATSAYTDSAGDLETQVVQL